MPACSSGLSLGFRPFGTFENQWFGEEIRPSVAELGLLQFHICKLLRMKMVGIFFLGLISL